MSSYHEDTRRPDTGAVEHALWSDNHFGQHRYGVIFPSDGSVWRVSEGGKLVRADSASAARKDQGRG